MIGLLLALLLVALLVVISLRSGVFEDKPGSRPLDRKKQAEGAACEVNRKEIESRLAIRAALGPAAEGTSPTGAGGALDESAGFRLCPAGGRYSVSGGHVACSIHGPFPGRRGGERSSTSQTR